jgi:galactose mutarotase-like enzyme
MPLQGLIPLITIVGDLITRKHVKHALHGGNKWIEWSIFDVDNVLNDALKISAKERCDGWWSWHKLSNGG